MMLIAFLKGGPKAGSHLSIENDRRLLVFKGDGSIRQLYIKDGKSDGRTVNYRFIGEHPLNPWELIVVDRLLIG